MFKLVHCISKREIKKSPIDDSPLLFKSAEEAETYCDCEFKCFNDYDLVSV
jgi:hypothetical protein